MDRNLEQELIDKTTTGKPRICEDFSDLEKPEYCGIVITKKNEPEPTKPD